MSSKKITGNEAMSSPINTHHAFLLEGSGGEEMLKAWGVTREVYGADYVEFIYDRLSIGEVRALIERAHLTPSTMQESVLIVRANSILREAQNALLKLLEEPPSRSKLFFLIPEYDALLPTVLSRFSVYTSMANKEEVSIYKKDAEVFLSSSPHDRMRFVEAFLKKENDPRALVDAFQDALRKELFRDTKNLSLRDSLKELVAMRSYLSDLAPSKKQILEYLAAILPRI